jgi:hypothetical protein
MKHLKWLLVTMCLLLSTSQAQAVSDRNPGAEAEANALFAYLLTPNTNLGTDATAQERWLSPRLIALLIRTRNDVSAARAAGKEDMGPDPHEPDNDDFLFSWDSPTTCVATSSETYRDRYLVFVYCGWGRRTNYPGMSAEYTLVMVPLSDQWLVDEIRFLNRDEKRRSTLSAGLNHAIEQAKRFRIRGHW